MKRRNFCACILGLGIIPRTNSPYLIFDYGSRIDFFTDKGELAGSIHNGWVWAYSKSRMYARVRTDYLKTATLVDHAIYFIENMRYLDLYLENL